MKKFYIVLLLVLITISDGLAQRRANVIYWGEGNCMNVNSDPPVYSVNHSFYSNFYTTSICDTAGNLIFYSNGGHTYSGQGYMKNDRFNNPFVSRNDFSCLLVNKPGNDSIFYLLTSEFDESTAYKHFLWSELNKNKQAFTANINIELKKYISGAIAATMHCNGKDIWIVVHAVKGNAFYAYLLTENRIDPNPVVSYAGPSDADWTYDYTGTMKFSPNGKLLAVGHSDHDIDDVIGKRMLELYNFNNTTGKVSKERYYTGLIDPNCPAFSPDSKLLYVVATDKIRTIDTFRLYQFNLTGNDNQLKEPAIIHTFRSSADPHGTSENATIQLLSDGKMYCFTDGYWALYQINSPGKLGLACDFKKMPIELKTGDHLASFNTVSNYLDPGFKENDLRIESNKTFCSNRLVHFQIQKSFSSDSIKWLFKNNTNGRTDTLKGEAVDFKLPTDGNMQVKAFVYGGCKADSVEKDFFITNTAFRLPDDTLLCTGQSLDITPKIENATYLWQDNSTVRNYKVTMPGLYWVKVSKNGCTYADSVYVKYNAIQPLDLGKDTALCEGDSLSLKVNLSDVHYLWSTGKHSNMITVRNSGIYWVKAATETCSVSDTIEATFNPIPVFDLGKDTAVCESQPVNLRGNVSGESYLWSNGSTLNGIAVKSPGLYWAKVEKSGCSYSDSIYVSYKPKPAIDLGPDTAICINGQVILNAFNSSIRSYLWSNGTTNSTSVILQTGKYWVVVQGNNNCYNSDTVSVSASKTMPVISFGKDISICPGQILILDPKIDSGNNTFLWQNGSTSSTYAVSQPGNYHLTVTNECGSRSVEATVKQGGCDLWMPNAFTPNHDGRNDVFRVKYPGFIKTFSFMIYNRWGYLIFKTTDPSEGWDGEYKGVEQPAGGYLWVIHYLSHKNKSGMARGNVMLIR